MCDTRRLQSLAEPMVRFAAGKIRRRLMRKLPARRAKELRCVVSSRMDAHAQILPRLANPQVSSCSRDSSLHQCPALSNLPTSSQVLPRKGAGNPNNYFVMQSAQWAFVLNPRSEKLHASYAITEGNEECAIKNQLRHSMFSAEAQPNRILRSMGVAIRWGGWIPQKERLQCTELLPINYFRKLSIWPSRLG